MGTIATLAHKNRQKAKGNGSNVFRSGFATTPAEAQKNEVVTMAIKAIVLEDI